MEGIDGGMRGLRMNGDAILQLPEDFNGSLLRVRGEAMQAYLHLTVLHT